MIFRLLHKPKYYHLKIIHDHHKGVQNRFKDNADKWIEHFRHPHVKTYVDYCYNAQKQQHDFDLKTTQKQQNYVQKIKYAYKPGVSMITEYHKLVKTERPDDYEMERDVSEMTIKQFIQEGRQNFTPVHQLVVYCFGFVILHTVLYFTFIYDKQLPKNQRVKVLNAQYNQSYHFDIEQPQLRRIIQRIELVNGQFQKQLNLSKNSK